MPIRLLGLVLGCVSALAQPLLTHTDVFRAGVGGYHSYRIPALLTAANGSLLAFAEARRDNRGDPGNGDIDLVLSRSSDQGRTWLKFYAESDKQTNQNTMPYTPSGWGGTLLQALSECMGAVRRFPYEGD